MTVGMDAAKSIGEVAPRGPQPTQIEVHIHQESALAKLLQSMEARLLAPKAATASHWARLLVASWTMQLVLGVLSGVLGGLLYLGHYSTVRGSGAAIWTGAVAVLAGAVAFIYEKRRGIFWAFLKSLLVLAVFATAVTAIVIAASNFNDFYYFYNGDEICDVSSSVWPTLPPSTPSSEETKRFQLCLSYVYMLKTMSLGLHATLIALWSLLIFTSLSPLILFFWKICLSKKKTDQKKLLAGNGI